MIDEKLTAAREAEIRAAVDKWTAPQIDHYLRPVHIADWAALLAEIDRLRALQATQAPGPLPTREELARQCAWAFEHTDTGPGSRDQPWESVADVALRMLTQHAHAAPVPLQVTDHDVWDACMTWRHDFGLLAPNDEDRKNLEYDMRKILTQYVERVTKRSPEPARLHPAETELRAAVKAYQASELDSGGRLSRAVEAFAAAGLVSSPEPAQAVVWTRQAAKRFRHDSGQDADSVESVFRVGLKAFGSSAVQAPSEQAPKLAAYADEPGAQWLYQEYERQLEACEGFKAKAMLRALRKMESYEDDVREALESSQGEVLTLEARNRETSAALEAANKRVSYLEAANSSLGESQAVVCGPGYAKFWDEQDLVYTANGKLRREQAQLQEQLEAAQAVTWTRDKASELALRERDEAREQLAAEVASRWDAIKDMEQARKAGRAEVQGQLEAANKRCAELEAANALHARGEAHALTRAQPPTEPAKRVVCFDCGVVNGHGSECAWSEPSGDRFATQRGQDAAVMPGVDPDDTDLCAVEMPRDVVARGTAKMHAVGISAPEPHASLREIVERLDRIDATVRTLRGWSHKPMPVVGPQELDELRARLDALEVIS